MELIAPCGPVAPRHRNYTHYRTERNEALPNSFVSLRVEEAFAADPVLLGTRIVVETFEGIVQLSGIALWHYQLSWAKQVAWRVGGVCGIRSCMQLARTAEFGPTAGARPHSAEARRPCLEELAGEGLDREDGQGLRLPARSASLR